MVAIVVQVKAAERGTFAIVPRRVVAQRFRVRSLACALDVVRAELLVGTILQPMNILESVTSTGVISDVNSDLFLLYTYIIYIYIYIFRFYLISIFHCFRGLFETGVLPPFSKLDPIPPHPADTPPLAPTRSGLVLLLTFGEQMDAAAA